MKNYDIINNTSLISTISKDEIRSINRIMSLIIGSILSEQTTEQAISCDIGIGKIIIMWDEEDVKFDFIPSAEFSEMILQGLDKQPVLIDSLQKALTNKIIGAYKDLL